MWAIGTGSTSGYNINRSLRFRAAAGSYLNRTPASASNRKTWTWSGWVKRGAINATYQILFGAIPSGAAYTLIGFDTNEKITFWEYPTVNPALVTTQVFRDISAHMHIMVAYDTTQATATNRIRLYVNGLEITSFSADNRASVTQNINGSVNNNVTHIISSENPTTNNYFFDGVMSEVNFVDGQQLTPSSFGQFDSTTGVWVPKRYTGTYGTNGFYLNFSDNSALTTSSNVGLGRDFSSNGNYWTTNNISITAGPTYDSFTDVPTLTSATAANYAVLNYLNKGSTVTLSSGNLNYSGGTAATCRSISSIGMTTGKWHAEYTTLDTSTLPVVGIVLEGESPDAGYVGATANSYGWYALNGNKFNNNAYTAYSTAWGATIGTVVGIDFDADNRTLSFSLNGVSQGIAFSSIPAGTFFFAQGDYSTTYTGAFNFGQRPFIYPTDGYLALNTFNLPDPVIKMPNKNMDVSIYTGTSASQNIVNSGAMQPDLVWIKSRSGAVQHDIFDTVRGITLYSVPNTTAAETTDAGYHISSINSNGFSLQNSGTGTNASGSTYVGWQWKKGATPGFDIVAYTGTGSVQNINHSLGVAPKLMILKSRSAAGNWPTYHESLTAGYSVYLNLTNTSAPSAHWNSTAPTSSVFTVGVNSDVNTSSTTYIAYLWAEIAGYSKIGSYIGNGAADGPFVNCGFRPKFILVKDKTSANTWIMWDSVRDSLNISGLELYPNASTAEPVNSSDIDIVSNGFKIRRAATNFNTSTNIYVFAAFAENPFKYAVAR